MRRIGIALGIILFLVYCWASVAYQNRATIPDYKPVEVDLLGGMSREAWEADSQAAFQRLMELEGKKYQFPHGEPGSGRALSAADFEKLIAGFKPDEKPVVRLLDAGAVHALADRHYVLRDNIYSPSDPEGQPVYLAGRPLDKALLDELRELGFRTVTVSGHGAPVNFQLGTAIMVAIIFLTLAAALKPALWEPFLAMLEKRAHELETGEEATRQNQLEAVRYGEEDRRRHAELNREIQELRLKGKRQAALEAAAITKKAKDQESALKAEGLRELGEASQQAEEELRQRIPEFAQAVADALTPGRGGPRWDLLAEKEETDV